MNINFMGGEPLLHWDDMVRIMDNLRPRIPGISFSIITNGTLMDGARANYILKHDNIVVSVSHDGPGQYLRGKDPLAPRSESYAAIMHILNRAPQRINFNPVLTRPNHRADHIMRYLEERLHNPICLSEAMPCKLTGMEQALRFGMSGDTLTDMQKGIMNLMFGTHLERVQTWMEIFCLLVDVTLKGHPLPPHGRCMAFYGLPYGIDLNGDVHRCTSCEGECFPGTDVRNIAGNLIDWWKDNASLEEIGTCLADGARLPNHLTRPECRRCPFVVGCSGGCPSMREEFFSLSCAQERAFLQAHFRGLSQNPVPRHVRLRLPIHRREGERTMKNRYLPHKWRRDSTLLGGGFLAHDKQFLILADAFHRHGFGRFLDSVFGGQPCAWHAGRIIDTPIPEDGLEAYLHFILPAYTERGISCRLNFSAPDITPGMLADTKANMMLRVLHEYNINTDKPHGVIVSSDMLREYIRESFPVFPSPAPC